MISMEGWRGKRQAAWRSSAALRRTGTSSLSSLSLCSRLCASAWAPFRSQNSLRDPRLPAHCPLALGIVGHGVGPLLPTAPTPRERERRGGEGSRPSGGLQRKGGRAQPMVRPKPHRNLFLRWFRKAQRDSVRGKGGSFFSSVAPTIQLLFTEPVGQE